MDRRFHGAFTASTTAAKAIGTRGRHGWLSLVGGGYELYLPTYLGIYITIETRAGVSLDETVFIG